MSPSICPARGRSGSSRDVGGDRRVKCDRAGSVMDRWARPCAVLTAGALTLLLSGCSWSPGGAGLSEAEKLDQQAQAALSRWAATVAAAGGHQGVVLVGDLTVQIGGWEVPVGDNDKPALMAGLVQPAISLPALTSAEGQVTRQDGTTQAVPLMSAQQAVAAITADAAAAGGAGSCPDCVPLRITGARLTSMPFATTQGSAIVPAWEFTLQATAVNVMRVAIADPVTVAQPPWTNPPWGDGGDAPVGIVVRSASTTVDSRQLTVGFDGAALPRAQACGTDYTAEAVESSLAVVIIVDAHPNPSDSLCELSGAPRTATATLASPLGLRTVLEVTQGNPVVVQHAP